jgi:hypothetical protein
VLATEVDELVRCARRVRAHHDLDRLDQLGRDLREGMLNDRDMVAGGVRPRFASMVVRGRVERFGGVIGGDGGRWQLICVNARAAMAL